MKTVFIAGNFDLFHEGHRYILSKAKGFGNKLIVATNTDDDIQRRKGWDRPKDSITIRAQNIYEAGADLVIGFEGNDWLLKIIKDIKPDIICVGSDYTTDKVVGAEECKEWGGQVFIIDRIPNISTTQIINGN